MPHKPALAHLMAPQGQTMQGDPIQEEHDPRVARFAAMVSDDPDNELAQFSLGQALLDAGRPAEAEACFRAAYTIQPDLMMAWQRRAECLMTLKHYEEAREMAQRTLELAIAQHHAGPRADAEELLEEIEDALS